MTATKGTDAYRAIGCSSWYADRNIIGDIIFDGELINYNEKYSYELKSGEYGIDKKTYKKTMRMEVTTMILDGKSEDECRNNTCKLTAIHR